MINRKPKENQLGFFLFPLLGRPEKSTDCKTFNNYFNNKTNIYIFYFTKYETFSKFQFLRDRKVQSNDHWIFTVYIFILISLAEERITFLKNPFRYFPRMIISKFCLSICSSV